MKQYKQMVNQYNVNIAGYGLIVETERSALHMERLTETLNGKVREIQKTGGTANYLNVVMLAAMELADDTLVTKDLVVQIREESKGLEEKAQRFEEEANVLKERLKGLGKEISALRAEVEVLRKEREGIRERFERRNRDILEVLDNALK
ncbi:MAG: cell division protein ZapA [Syntrophorhabdaceae bacterium]|nr:cell division protein ZapA [Syntrophorhabdaceae bacterium]